MYSTWFLCISYVFFVIFQGTTLLSGSLKRYGISCVFAAYFLWILYVFKREERGEREERRDSHAKQLSKNLLRALSIKATLHREKHLALRFLSAQVTESDFSRAKFGHWKRFSSIEITLPGSGQAAGGASVRLNGRVIFMFCSCFFRHRFCLSFYRFRISFRSYFYRLLRSKINFFSIMYKNARHQKNTIKPMVF